MVDIERVARTEMEVLLFIDGEEYHVAQFSMDFSINTIPTATALLAVGVDVHTGKPATIHRTASKLKSMLVAEVFFEPKNDSEWRPQGPLWPAGRTRIFKGYVTGFGTAKIRGSMRAVVNLTHWLVDLNFSSCLSNQSHPCNPNQFSWRACFPGQGAMTGADEMPHYNVESMSRDIFLAEQVSTDLWACIHKFFNALAEQDLFKFTPANWALQGIGKSNPRAKRALALIETEAGVTAQFKPSRWWKPLSLKMGDGATKQIAEAIAYWIQRESLQSYAATTFWDKLITEISPVFMFSVIPLVETAIIAPLIPGLQQPYIKKLRADETSYLQIDSHIPKPLRGVSVTAGYESYTNCTDREGGDVHSELGAGGCFSPAGAEDDGLVLTKPAPAWLTNVPVLTHDPANTVISADRSERTAATVMPKAKCVKGDQENKTPCETAKSCKDILTRLAEAIYVQETLRGRIGVVHGKLRFDIAPGSTVYVENTREIHLGAADLLGSEDFVADVVRVSVMLDSEGAQAGTSFQLAHVRSNTENKDVRFSIKSHPLYDQQYTGAPLIEKYLFEEVADA